MKKKYLLVIFILALGSCSNDENWKSINAKDNHNTIEYGVGATVIIVNKCQYVIYVGNNSGDVAMVHAGNCNNPEHKK